MKRLLPLFVLLVSGSAFAQEFGRASGGDLSMMTKSPSRFSGTLAASFGFGSGYGGTVSGTVLKDRMWVFGSAEQLKAPRFAPAPSLNVSSFKVSAQPSGRVSADFAVPSNFLSLRSTLLLSPSSYISVSASQTK